MLFSPLALFCRRAVQLVGCKSHPASLCPSASRMVGGSWLVAAWGDSPSQLQPRACVLVALGQCPLLPEEQNQGLPVGGGNTLGFFCARHEPGGGSGFVRPCWGLVWGRDSHTVKCSVSQGGFGRDVLCGVWLGMEVGAHKEANTAPRCIWVPLARLKCSFPWKPQNRWFCFILGITAPITPRCFTPLPVSAGEKVQAEAPRAHFIIKSRFTCLSRSPSGCCGTS